MAAKAINGSWAAVDFIASEKPKTKPPYILEVNHSPGTEGIEKATNKNIVKQVIDFYSNPDNRYSVPTQCGWEEIIEVKPFGDVVAKFDTGNGATASTIHADKLEVKGKQVIWTYNNKTITSKVQRVAKVDVGGLNDYSEERYAVLLNIEFAGTLYKNVEFLLDDREDRSPILLNRKTMRMLNVMVNPQRKFVVTTQYTLDK